MAASSVHVPLDAVKGYKSNAKVSPASIERHKPYTAVGGTTSQQAFAKLPFNRLNECSNVSMPPNGLIEKLRKK